MWQCAVLSYHPGAAAYTCHHACCRYGTSINWFTAMDPACDVLLAYEQNGERLTPDHGYPLRLIIPGYIGGRMIKWLNEISVRRLARVCARAMHT